MLFKVSWLLGQFVKDAIYLNAQESKMEEAPNLVVLDLELPHFQFTSLLSMLACPLTIHIP
jgi:hypothetical protein